MGKLVFTVNCCRLVIYLSKVCVTLKKLFISTLLPHPLYPDPIVNPPPGPYPTRPGLGTFADFFNHEFFFWFHCGAFARCLYFLYRQGIYELVPSTQPGWIVSEIFLMACGTVFLYPSLKLISETSFTVNLMYLQSMLVLVKYFINIFSYFYTVQQW